MKIDIKNIVKSLSEGQIEIATETKTVDIRQALGEAQKEPETEQAEAEAPETDVPEPAEEAPEPEAEETADVAEETAEAVETADAVETTDAVEETSEPEEEADAEPEIRQEPEEEPEPAPEPETEEEPEPAPEPEEEEEPETEVPGTSEAPEPSEEASEPEAEPAPAPEEETEDASASETAPAAARLFHKEKIMAWGRSYGWITGIAASFVILMAFMVIYTTMTPRQIEATINGEVFSFTTKEHTVEGFLEDEGISFCAEDYISIPLTAFIQDGMRFELRHATQFTLTADGKTKKHKTLGNTVQQALDDVGITLGERDIVTPDLDALLKKDMKITVQRVIATQQFVDEAIPFKTVKKDDVSMNEGTSKVVTEGKDGKARVTYEIIYVDGKETSRKEVAREIITAAVDEVIANGTRVNYNGQVYSKKLVVKAYAYTGGGTTAMGTRARVGEIAVDPSVIPLGTNVYIEGVGARRAEDTGGNIKGNTIDIYMNTQAECLSWGVRYVTIYIQ